MRLWRSRHKLVLSDHVNKFDASNGCGGGVESLEAHHDMPKNKAGAYRIRTSLKQVTLAEIFGMTTVADKRAAVIASAHEKGGPKAALYRNLGQIKRLTQSM